ncbi:unnamed protein product [Cylindrotheca closterium]|uniref:Uncharacterized protein n=1 Tax=Cylindrotheca closterium TaxID=2856 RepID=A0AAD2G4Q3_9STRA|nr:unnamed protein product [Cylindrotheca closterium]
MLSADDFQVRCTVRKAINNEDDDKEFSEPEDMTCTMRVWHGPKKSSQDAELLLKPVEQRTMSAMRSRADELSPVLVNKRFSSFGEGRNNRFQMEQEQLSQASSIGTVKLPLQEILIVEKKGQELSDPTIHIFTVSSGCYEFTLNENGRAILLAFLQANLPKERIRGGFTLQRTKSDVSRYSCSTIGNKTLDVEALTSNKVAERIESETMSEKLGTKVGRAFSSILEMVECSCISCGGSSSSSVHPEPIKPLSPSDTKENKPKAKKMKTAKKTNLEDCGFSVESEPKMELVR